MNLPLFLQTIIKRRGRYANSRRITESVRPSVRLSVRLSVCRSVFCLEDSLALQPVVTKRLAAANRSRVSIPVQKLARRMA